MSYHEFLLTSIVDILIQEFLFNFILSFINLNLKPLKEIKHNRFVSVLTFMRLIGTFS